MVTHADLAALLRTAPVARISDDGRVDGDRLPDAGPYRLVREADARALLSLTQRTV